jgi:UDP-N-acetylglucosamine--N-acetylmuramyl-(pentapeptide) pyrophosphoryl-undecaprenol N-acetylglucosamine transferase
MRVLISGGGTGGHLFPAIAVAQALSRRDPEGSVLFVGREDGIEGRTVPTYKIPFEPIVAAGLYTEEFWRNWRLPIIIPRAVWQARGILRRFRPDVVLGTGGYVSAPVVLASAMAKLPIVLQEQNLVPGRATRMLSRFAAGVAIAFQGSAKLLKARTVLTGTPVRSEFGRRRSAFPRSPKRVLVLGGSQGAHRINQAIVGALDWMVVKRGLEVEHQTGEADLGLARAAGERLPAATRNRYRPFAFSSEIAGKIYSADLVISRAGASTLSEVSAVGIPMVLVPYPYAGGHQKANARELLEAGAVRVIEDAVCDPEHLVQTLTGVSEPEKYAGLVSAMGSQGRPEAADRVVDLLYEVRG